ncbi:tripartite tricarboxylate transporter permease [Nocardiopsis mangrovi]|uniref:Tripartite tricarboxylate transporter permease n=1 Tax=Nocardiopsis mangrovi TaxID=1179818 RepID=A0ABV9DQV4_9ACTN
MDVLNDLLAGFANALLLRNLLLALAGVTIGTLVGVLPGLGPATTVALLLPLTFVFDPIGALVLFAGIYYGGMYGGSTTAILLNVPGESASVPTTLDGHPMAKKGRGGAALATAAIGSFVAGTISTVAITFLGPAMAEVGKAIQPAEYFAIMVLAFVTVTSLVGSSVLRGLASLFLGLAVGLVGIDALTGQPRYTFATPQLYEGIDLVLLAVGLFAIGEALYTSGRLRSGAEEVVPVRGRVWMDRSEWKRSWKPWLRGTAIGLPIGSLPAGGAEIPTFLSYALERRLSRHKDEFGKGAIEGVAGPEAANNAAFSGVLVPLLTLGIPTSATAAVLLMAFQVYNVQPGPTLFEEQSALVWTLIASLYIGNVMLLVLNLPMVKLWVKLLSIPREILAPAILIVAVLGMYAAVQSVFGVVLGFAFGALGFLMRRTGYPLGPMVLGAILGPLLESQFRLAMAFSEGDPSIFVTRPVSAAILAVALVMLVLPTLVRRRAKGEARARHTVGD